MRCRYACRSDQHQIARRRFLGDVAASGSAVVGGLAWLARPASARQLESQQKHVIVINMHGGLSQLESWDPKPKTDTGGPFRAIPTSVPGVHISELLPETAKQMHHLTLVRGINTKENDHGKGAYMMLTGRKRTPAADFPKIGAVVAKSLETRDQSLPGHIVVTPGGSGGRGNDAAYLGPKYSSVVLGNGNPPPNTTLSKGVSSDRDATRHELRRRANERFLSQRRTAMTDVYTYNYEQALQLMAKREVFDISRESAQDQQRYGKHDFGRHCLLARRLLEHGVSFVQVSHSNYDTHNENFTFHFEQMGEFDRPFARLVADLADRGMLEHTLIVVLSEFGRTPGINNRYGRDHWSAAWSVCMAGGRLERGAAYGKTNDQGTAVVDGQVDHAMLFHTYLEAIGVDASGEFEVAGRALPVADPSSTAIDEILT